MVKKVRSTKYEIAIDGVKVQKELKPYLLSISFNDKSSIEVDDLTIILDDRDDLFSDEWMPMIGDAITGSIFCSDWDINIDGTTNDYRFDFGAMEIDLVTHKGPPDTVEIKAVSSINSSIRKTLNNKQWKASTLALIGKELAIKHKLKFEFIAVDAEDQNTGVEIAAATQSDQSDLDFLIKICDDNGYIVKLDADYLMICSQSYLELQNPTLVISRDEISNRTASRGAFNLYKEVKASYFCPKTKKPRVAKASWKDAVRKTNPEAIAEYERTHPQKTKAKSVNPPKTPTKPVSYFANNGGTKVLVLRQKYKDEAEARKNAIEQLAKKNRGEWFLSGDVMGNPLLMAGIVIEVTDYGQYSGKYYVDSTTHSYDNGYRTSFSAHKCLIEGQA